MIFGITNELKGSKLPGRINEFKPQDFNFYSTSNGK